MLLALVIFDAMDTIKRTQEAYGFLWSKEKENSPPPQEWHFNKMQEAIDEPIVRGSVGIDIGSGQGFDTYIMAKNNPQVKIVSIDISDGIFNTKRLTSGFNNVKAIKCSCLDMPLKDGAFDFAYSFGVLHHTLNPEQGLLEIFRILRNNSPAFLYLYEDHSESPVKYIAIRMISAIRYFTISIPQKVLYGLSWMFSPLVYVIFTLPSKILRISRKTERLSEKIPFNFGKDLFSLRGDLYDRFSAPVEHRFSSKKIRSLLEECGFKDINIGRLKGISGWVVWGYKK